MRSSFAGVLTSTSGNYLGWLVMSVACCLRPLAQVAVDHSGWRIRHRDEAKLG
jgi:hypothetical protein